MHLNVGPGSSGIAAAAVAARPCSPPPDGGAFNHGTQHFFGSVPGSLAAAQKLQRPHRSGIAVTHSGKRLLVCRLPTAASSTTATPRSCGSIYTAIGNHPLNGPYRRDPAPRVSQCGRHAARDAPPGPGGEPKRPRPSSRGSLGQAVPVPPPYDALNFLRLLGIELSPLDEEHYPTARLTVRHDLNKVYRLPVGTRRHHAGRRARRLGREPSLAGRGQELHDHRPVLTNLAISRGRGGG